MVLMVLLGVGGAVAATSRATPQYQANTQLFVATQGAGNVDQLIQGNSLIQQRVQSYAQLVANRDQLRRAIETLEAVDARVLGVVMNFLPAKSADAYGYYASEPTPDKATRQVVMPFKTRAG